MIPIVTSAEMRAIDAEALRRTSESTLVARAGTAVGHQAIRMMGGAYGRRVFVLAGKGNNGADGRCAARLLAARGAKVRVVPPDEAPLRIERPVDLVVDAAYGTGFHGELHAPAVDPGIPVLAVDIPSGVSADTGEALGEPLAADRTVTFGALKPGLVQWHGRRLAGSIVLAGIGLDVSRARMGLVEDSDVVSRLAERPLDAHKWSSAVLVVAGSPGMLGAARFAASGASRAGAGMVRLGVPGCPPGDLPAGEAVGEHLAGEGWAPRVLEISRRCRSIVIGPGLGRSEDLAAQLRELIAGAQVPVVVDADGLAALGSGACLAQTVSSCPSVRVLLTPHDGEYERLAGHPPGPDRIAAAVELAGASGATVLLKGPTTVVASPQGQVMVVTAGSPRLATAGTGDVLSGMIGAFLARSVEPPLGAAALAAHVHARAAGLGMAEGLLAHDLPELVASWLSAVREGSPAGETGAAGVAGFAGLPVPGGQSGEWGR